MNWLKRLMSGIALTVVAVVAAGPANARVPGSTSAARSTMVLSSYDVSPVAGARELVDAGVPVGAWCDLKLTHPGARTASSGIWRARGGLAQLTWTIPTNAAGGVWQMRLACASSHRAAIRHRGQSASATFRLTQPHRRLRGTIARSIRVGFPRSNKVEPTGLGGGSYPPFGTLLIPGSAWLAGQGVNVYSNGADGGSGYYQCVELINRFLTTRGWSPSIYGNANQLYGNASAAYFDKHPNGSGYQPVPGDIVVWGGGYGGYGHVSIVDANSGGLLTVVEENSSPTGYGTNPISPSGAIAPTAYGYYVEGFLHARADHFTNGSTSTPEHHEGLGPLPGSTDLDFIKVRNTSGTVEVHWATGPSGYQSRGGDFASDFSPGDAENGNWQVFGSANGAPELGFVKLRNTGTGAVEVHWDTLQGSSYKRVGDFVSDFSAAEAANGTFQLFGTTNGTPELGFIKTANTGTGAVEVHWDTLHASGKYERAGDFLTDFSQADGANGTWQLFGTSGGTPELGFIKTANTGTGAVEVHWDTLQGSSYKRAGDFLSDFSQADGPNGAWQLFGSANGAPELGFIKLRNGGSATVEVHWDTWQGSFKRVGDSTSDFGVSDAGNGFWQIGPF